MTAFYSILHFLVDGVCAAAMFGNGISRKDGYFLILLYNFCAFALQMPFGVALDMLNAEEEKRIHGAVSLNAGIVHKKRNWNLMTAVIGVLFTIAGAVTHPVLLGIGNALFHVGGGVGTICESRKKEERGRKGLSSAGSGALRKPDTGGNDVNQASDSDRERKRLLARLGIFVAPGALGLYLGMLLAKSGNWSVGFLCGSAAMLLFCGVVLCAGLECPKKAEIAQPSGAGAEPVTDTAGILESSGSPAAEGRLVFLSICCLLVVVLRSHIGMAVTFSWKTGVFTGLAAVLAVAGGKTAGGYLAAWGGAERTAAVSLVLASVCYLFSSVMPIGLAALFLFNMTMPITLYWMILALPQKPGFAFGFLTFALFLGFLPGYLNVQTGLAGNVTGCAGSLLSLLILAMGTGISRRDGRGRAGASEKKEEFLSSQSMPAKKIEGSAD